MREGWTYKKLGDCLSYIKNGANIKQTKGANGIPITRIETLSGGVFNRDRLGYADIISAEKYSQNILDDGDILMSHINSKAYIGRSVLYKKEDDEQIIHGMNLLRLKVIPSILLPSYLNTSFQSVSFRDEVAKIRKDAVNQSSMAISDLVKIIIPVPPLSEQQRIVSELDLLSSIIEKKKAQLKEYDQLAQSVFYDMFALYEDNTATSNFILSLKGGKSLAGDEECKNKILKTGAVTYDYFKCDEVKNLPNDYIPLPENLLKDGDLLISRMNTLEYVGAVAYVWKAPNNTYIPDRLWRAKLNINVNPIFLWFSLIQPKAKEQIRSLSSGTSGSMKNISIPRFLSVLIKNPPLSLQQSFASKIEAIERQKALIRQSITETETLFDSRMDFWFS